MNRGVTRGVTSILELTWLTEASVFELRQRGREVGTALGYDPRDQIRLAVALSEVGREILSDQPATARFEVRERPPELVVSVVAPEPPTPVPDTSFDAARRLVDDIAVTVAPVEAGPAHAARALTLVLTKRLPLGAVTRPEALHRLRETLRSSSVHSPVEELRQQNADLMHTLDQLTTRQQELIRLNEELEETNRGVVAMYTQLSTELEETNRGVVALYAELDEKGQQLAEANEAKTRFLRSVSHELRAPVNSILGLTELLGESGLDDEQRRQVGYLRSSSSSLLRLVNELLDLGRAESGGLDIHVQAVELRRLFSELRGTLRPVAERRGVDLVVDEPDLAEVPTDGELLARVLRNLLTNAVAFTEQGQVRMTAASPSGDHVEIVVSDTGIGIPPEYQSRVFEEFVQVPGRLQSTRKGTGLGLPYARRVTEALGGTLTLDSEVGRGSTFTVTLPVQVPDEGDPENAVAVELGHVLVVDDDEAFRHLIRGMLQGAAARVSEAGNGAEALDSVHRLIPDILLLDLRMPDVDGGEVLSRLREDPDPRLRDLPAVLMTSVDIDAEVRRAAEPAAALLTKSRLTRAGLLRLLGDLAGRSAG